MRGSRAWKDEAGEPNYPVISANKCVVRRAIGFGRSRFVRGEHGRETFTRFKYMNLMNTTYP